MNELTCSECKRTFPKESDEIRYYKTCKKHHKARLMCVWCIEAYLITATRATKRQPNPKYHYKLYNMYKYFRRE